MDKRKQLQRLMCHEVYEETWGKILATSYRDVGDQTEKKVWWEVWNGVFMNVRRIVFDKGQGQIVRALTTKV